MKVTYIGKSDLKVPEKPAKPSRQVPQEGAKTGEMQQDRVRLSKDVQKLLGMEKGPKGADKSEARAEVVERLRREIKEGRYSPDSRTVADKMIAEAAKTLGED
jgi:flagellar biosynthesis anti-sigma factor FlgM